MTLPANLVSALLSNGAPKPSAHIVVDPNSIVKGGSATLSWTTNNALEASLGGVGDVALSGSTTVSPTATTDYVLTAKNLAHETQASARLTVRDLAVGGSMTFYCYTAGNCSGVEVRFGADPAWSCPFNSTRGPYVSRDGTFYYSNAWDSGVAIPDGAIIRIDVGGYSNTEWGDSILNMVSQWNDTTNFIARGNRIGPFAGNAWDTLYVTPNQFDNDVTMAVCRTPGVITVRSTLHTRNHFNGGPHQIRLTRLG